MEKVPKETLFVRKSKNVMASLMCLEHYSLDSSLISLYKVLNKIR